MPGLRNPAQEWTNPELDHTRSVPMDATAPVIVKESAEVPAFRDYIPSQAKLERNAKNPPQYKRVETPRNQRVIVTDDEYLSFEKSEVKRKEAQSRIEALKDEILKSNAERIKRYKQAKKLLKTATDEQLANPTEELAKAKRIVDKGAPMTEAKALDEATIRVHGLRG